LIAKAAAAAASGSDANMIGDAGPLTGCEAGLAKRA
jgi:hypothetical protein